MEINITTFFNNAAPKDYSASAAEIGDNAGAYTWRAACDDANDYVLLDNEEKREAFRAFVKSSGGCDAQEIAAFSAQELQALCIQWISGDMREVPGIALGPGMTEEEWKDYEAMQEDGTVSSNIFRGPDNQVYFYIG